MADDSFSKKAGTLFSRCRRLDVLFDLADSLVECIWHLGSTPSACVAIMLPDIPEFAVSVVAAQRTVFTCVDVNQLCTPRQLKYQLNDSGVTAIIAIENFAVTLADVIGRTPVKHLVIASMSDLLGSRTESGAHLQRGTWAEKCLDSKCQWAKNARRLYVRKRSLMNQARRSNPRSTLKSGVFL